MRSSIRTERTLARIETDKERGGWIVRLIVWGLMATVVLPIGIALLLPAIQVYREKARRTQAQAALKQIGAGMRMYHDTYNMLPPSAIVAISKPVIRNVSKTTAEPLPPLDPSQFESFDAFVEAENERNPPPEIAPFLLGDKGIPQHGWMTSLLPYVDNVELYRRMDFSVPWDATQNRDAVATTVPQYLNPGMARFGTSGATADGKGASHYAGNSQVLRPNGEVQFADISDGLSTTVLAGEVVAGILPWSSPENVRDLAAGLGATDSQFGGPHYGLTQFLMCDGSVRVVINNESPEILRRLANPRDDQSPPGF